MLGVDMFNGGATQVQQFKNSTGATYPVLLLGGSSVGGDLNTLYGGVPTYDNYAVISKQGIVRYYASTIWPHGNRYHLNEIRAAVDSLVSTVDVSPVGVAMTLSLTGAPNPFRDALTVDVRVPTTSRGGEPRLVLTMHDARGRRVATLWNGAAPGGAARATWRGDPGGNGRLVAGAYWLRAESEGRVVSRRVVALP
ncbi:MAG: hypothetical protein ABIP29_02575 [Candidatus Eisenbacteria bacterium]